MTERERWHNRAGIPLMVGIVNWFALIASLMFTDSAWLPITLALVEVFALGYAHYCVYRRDTAPRT